MNDRRLVGIDLGIASAHTVRVLDGEGHTIAKRKAWPTVESLTEVEIAARELRIQTALSNSLGFGGHIISICIGRVD